MLVAAAMTTLSVALVTGLEARPRDPTKVAVIFPPFMTGERAFAQAAAAGGLVVRQGARDWILIVRGEDDGLAGRLYAAGAWAVIDPVAFGGCLAEPAVAR